MTAEQKQYIASYFDSHLEDMLADLNDLVAIPSVRGEAAENMPYGLAPKTALNRAEEMMEKAGLFTKIWDNRVVTGDLTELPSGLDILAHLDVVPCEDNWTVCKPYEMTKIGDKVYGRGTMDDKGPAIAALYAMRCVREMGIRLQKNVRLILGTDEECGSSDVDYYYAQVPEAPMTFTPDANFPLINLEKGRFPGRVSASFVSDSRLPYIASAECGMKSNVIPEYGTAVIAGLDKTVFEPIAIRIAAETGTEIGCKEIAGGLEISVRGTGAHAAYPEAGNNALTAMLFLLAELPCADSEGFRKVKALHACFPHGDYRGEAIGIAMQDEISGMMTSSADVLRIDETSLYLVFDARCPVCANEQNTKYAARDILKSRGLYLENMPMTLPHYVDPNCEFVRTLLRVYSEWSGEEGTAEGTGGGTYVHDLKNGVAFGCETKDVDNHIHGADEFITVDQLLMSGKIFAQSIIELCS